MLSRSRSVDSFQGQTNATFLFDTATGMKLQMVKMVKDLNTNNDRTSNARSIINSLKPDKNENRKI